MPGRWRSSGAAGRNGGPGERCRRGLGFPRGPSLPQGVTRLLLTRIPFFKEIIVSSFACDSCSWANTEIQSAGRIQEQGVRYVLAVTSRQVGAGCPVGTGELRRSCLVQLFVPHKHSGDASVTVARSEKQPLWFWSKTAKAPDEPVPCAPLQEQRGC